jgi:hypothetical protein
MENPKESSAVPEQKSLSYGNLSCHCQALNLCLKDSKESAGKVKFTDKVEIVDEPKAKSKESKPSYSRSRFRAYQTPITMFLKSGSIFANNPSYDPNDNRNKKRWLLEEQKRNKKLSKESKRNLSKEKKNKTVVETFRTGLKQLTLEETLKRRTMKEEKENKALDEDDYAILSCNLSQDSQALHELRKMAEELDDPENEAKIVKRPKTPTATTMNCYYPTFKNDVI